jgi:hypothetical protein
VAAIPNEAGWVDVIDRITPTLFRVYAGQSAGTGFIVGVQENQPAQPYAAIIATAWHVIADVVNSGEKVSLLSADRSTSFDTDRDMMHVAHLDPFVAERFTSSFMPFMSGA